MGGASTQITFVPEFPPKINGFLLDLSYSEYPLYTYSYPLGQDASLALLLQGIVVENVSKRVEGEKEGEKDGERKRERRERSC